MLNSNHLIQSLVFGVCGATAYHTSHDCYNIAEAVTDMKHYYY